ncbi:SDR family NAD(P)-dependent oxidoreductase [Planococcus liqunii]|uniref:SDR family NAD(P)-dependent oxidoreductase n=1 Tax=Planococcus liqunii TaxID=3058394 RepID=A0ABT8MUF3_9BACL|nr:MULTISPECIES: SDR family NAD(P)-dependent oxidoreductase [unclassified Planococcus (in: firmicutes)]MDN7228355.1 SDR family NAD(P)-dependent oxidoreductase [Planococcus sp. N064]WKA50863.1 SDR family NAD(P)-dependent oxidoreductase [Planococcus sp. N056]
MEQSVNSLQLTFEDKVALVTGAAHGIGKSICLELAGRGARVIALDILEEPLNAAKNEVEKGIKASGSSGKVITYLCDVTNSNAIASVIRQVIKKFGKIDILVNVAGGVAGQVHQPIEKVADDDWQKVIDINLKSTFFMVRAVVPHMKAAGYGRIVNISSGAGRSSSLTGIQAYTSAKAGQIGFTRQMARELGRFGITVNNVAPGFVLSNPATERQWKAMSDEEQVNLIQSISVKRLGTPEDIAHPVLFFASDFARYVSGQVISADGGMQLF